MRSVLRYFVIGVVFMSALSVGAVLRVQRVEAVPAGAASSAPSTADVLLAAAAAKAPPPPEQDTCQACHLTGSIDNLFYPLARWSVFGVVGLVFVYGTYRMASAWTTRAPWKPIPARTADWVDERYHVVEPVKKALAKPVPRFAMKWWYCLGGLTLAMFIVLAVTGVMLTFYYKPTPEEAYASIQYIEQQVRFGAAVRAIHHWAANAMIVLVVAHMLRVFISGAFKSPRELNWLSGVVLFVVTLAFGFTGYLLPWDQTAFWASTVGTEIAGAEPAVGQLALIFLRGGWDVSGVTLSRFFALHVMVLPVVIVLFLGAHFLMVRRQGVARPL